MTFKELNESFDKPLERIKHMSNKQVALCTVGMFLTLCVLSMVIFPLVKGLPIMGLPKEKDIVKVEITHPARSEETIVTDDADLIFFAHNVVGYLNHSWDEVTPVPETDFITIKYFEEDGTVTEIKANREHVIWEGKCYRVVEQGMFTGWVEGVFYDKTVSVTK